MLKADGEKLLGRLQEHIRSCGYPSWCSVATSEKGSYREADILDFLDKHLPVRSDGRPWRIIMGDDFSAHKTENCYRLAWQRGYILIIHGGGATPVTQTPDTELNQHVRREYTSVEGAHILDEMRTGAVVPKTSATKCIDMMMTVLNSPQLHLNAAQG